MYNLTRLKLLLKNFLNDFLQCFFHSWLYRYGTVVETTAHNDGSLDVVALLDHANKARFEKEFKVKLASG